MNIEVGDKFTVVDPGNKRFMFRRTDTGRNVTITRLTGMTVWYTPGFWSKHTDTQSLCKDEFLGLITEGAIKKVEPVDKPEYEFLEFDGRFVVKRMSDGRYMADAFGTWDHLRPILFSSHNVAEEWLSCQTKSRFEIEELKSESRTVFVIVDTKTGEYIGGTRRTGEYMSSSHVGYLYSSRADAGFRVSELDGELKL